FDRVRFNGFFELAEALFDFAVFHLLKAHVFGKLIGKIPDDGFKFIESILNVRVLVNAVAGEKLTETKQSFFNGCGIGLQKGFCELVQRFADFANGMIVDFKEMFVIGINDVEKSRFLFRDIVRTMMFIRGRIVFDFKLVKEFFYPLFQSLAPDFCFSQSVDLVTIVIKFPQEMIGGMSFFINGEWSSLRVFLNMRRDICWQPPSMPRPRSRVLSVDSF